MFLWILFVFFLCIYCLLKCVIYGILKIFCIKCCFVYDVDVWVLFLYDLRWKVFNVILRIVSICFCNFNCINLVVFNGYGYVDGFDMVVFLVRICIIFVFCFRSRIFGICWWLVFIRWSYIFFLVVIDNCLIVCLICCFFLMMSWCDLNSLCIR